jgi:hypothetical protein
MAKRRNDPVLESALQFRTPIIMVATSGFLWLWAQLFWGFDYVWERVFFSASVVVTAIAWTLQGWEPWAMWINQLAFGLPARKDRLSAVQVAAKEFFASGRQKRIQFGWTAAGALTPWIIGGIGSLLDGEPIANPGRAPMPWWGMLLLGLGEAARGRAIALFILAGELKRHWTEVTSRAEQIESQQAIT